MKLAFFKSYINKIMGSVFLLILTFATGAKASDASESVAPVQPVDIISLIAMGLLVFVILILLYVIYAFKVFLGEYSKSQISLEGSTQKVSLYETIKAKLTDAVPVEHEAAILTDHEYDGIRELDNNLPPWWKYMFYATIVFSFVYIGYYHFTDGAMLQEAEYHAEMKQAEVHKAAMAKLAANAVDETNVEFLKEPDRIAAGESIYGQNCSACHGKLGEGGVGPNLVDEYWLHGGSISDVFKSIKYGIPQKGMIAWQNSLTPVQIQEVTSYILTLKGTNPPNAKEAQGELYQE